ncbi:MAG TPA: magnesium chelatase [Syntrophomonadaceae bacterium]|nr:magnesium chelatase [Syntrophomonadaceae bacterium]
MKSYLQLTRHMGNNALFLAVEMSLVSTLRGNPLHIHAEGLRGTGKTTIMRSVKQILPNITRIKDCLYNCDPEKPHCPLHRNLTPQEIADLGTEEIPMPYLEISHSAKIGTVAGSIDLSKITNPSQPEAALLPGIIPQAHRGIVFVDEINRLADTSPEITDVLLDVMGTKPGRVQIEETGLPVVEVPVSVSVWAASNPDEEPGPLAEIRRQLSDRFDLVVSMGRPSTPEEVVEILSTNEEAQGKDRELSPQERKRLEKLQNDLADIALQNGLKMPDYLTNFLANLYIKYNIESLRALEAIRQAALLHCALRKRNQVLISDIMAVLPLALNHRVSPATLTEIMNAVGSRIVGDQPIGDNSNKKQREASPSENREGQSTDDEAPPMKARYLRDLFGKGAIKRESEL